MKVFNWLRLLFILSQIIFAAYFILDAYDQWTETPTITSGTFKINIFNYCLNY